MRGPLSTPTDHRTRLTRRHAVAALALATAGCALPGPTRIPMDQLRFPGRGRTLVVFLPGAYSRAREFVDEGLVAALQARAPGAEAIVAEAHFGYYQEQSILRRLREDIVLPARARGVQQVWLAGISLGGFGALGYGARHGSEVTGIVALAPYLGRRTLLAQIAQAGGPRAWAATAPQRTGDDLDADVWQWLAAPPAGAPPVWMGRGVDDRFADSHRVLAELLPPERRFEVPGGHDWPPWRALWQQWLARGLVDDA